MKTLGNLIWLIFGGFILSALAWLIVGIMWCVSIIGIPMSVCNALNSRNFPSGRSEAKSSTAAARGRCLSISFGSSSAVSNSPYLRQGSGSCIQRNDHRDTVRIAML